MVSFRESERNTLEDLDLLLELRSILLNGVIDNLNQFSLSNSVDQKHKVDLMKPLGELVLTFDILLRNPIDRKNEIYEYLKWTWDELGQGEYLKSILIARPDFIILSSVYSTFHLNGFRNFELYRLLKELSKKEFCKAIQYPNWRRLDLEFAFSKLDISEISKLTLEQTWVSQFSEPWIIEDDAMYAMTHEVFYLTDFGTISNYLSDENLTYLKTWVPVWEQIYIHKMNWDLLAEILIVSACIDDLSNHSVGFRLLNNQVDDNGFIRSPIIGGASLKRKSDSLERKEFLSRYHTTLVTLIACELWICKLDYVSERRGAGHS